MLTETFINMKNSVHIAKRHLSAMKFIFVALLIFGSETFVEAKLNHFCWGIKVTRFCTKEFSTAVVDCINFLRNQRILCFQNKCLKNGTCGIGMDIQKNRYLEKNNLLQYARFFQKVKHFWFETIA